MAIDISLAQLSRLTGCQSVRVLETVQSLWSGYGVIVRVELVGLPNHDAPQPAIVKFVSPPGDDQSGHKYGWDGNVSHQRKLSSYQNEFAWYRTLASECDANCRVPKLIAGEYQDPTWLFVLEDLDAAGFQLRHHGASEQQLHACIVWLANFHATFLSDSQASQSQSSGMDHGLWPIGTYWHLGTRPDELRQMPASSLKDAAAKIDQRLNAARFQTIVHGDAKLANFCFSDDDSVAAVDFQYVGGGCGMKDLAYLISSCLSEDECERQEQSLLTLYFDQLKTAVFAKTTNGFTSQQWGDLEAEWRGLYRFAWADFYRFLAGWSPGHWKMHRYSERLAAECCRILK